MEKLNLRALDTNVDLSPKCCGNTTVPLGRTTMDEYHSCNTQGSRARYRAPAE